MSALGLDVTDRKWSSLTPWLRFAMGAGTVLLLALLFVILLRQPFEAIDDLIWLNKLRGDSFSSLLLSPAWMLKSSFYRPAAEIVLKIQYVFFGLDPRPYRYVQFAIVLLLLWLSLRLMRQLKLRLETIFLLSVFVIGSPFITGSIAWLSELPHVIVLVCFVVGLIAITSALTENRKLAICTLAFAVALLSKENGLALTAFLIYFVRSLPVRSALAFAAVIAGYFAMRALVLGPSMGLSAFDEDGGYFFSFLTGAERRQMFSGAVYQLYAYDILAQVAAILFRATAWGQIVGGINREVVIEAASTLVIFAGAAAAYRRHGAVFVILAIVAIGGTVFSYAYARDRHLALPALAYGFLLVMATDELCRRFAAMPIVPLFCLWLAWAAQAGLALRAIDHLSTQTIEEVYRPNASPLNPNLPSEVWTAARERALSLR